ncbi:MAG: DUF134 domain-containing protein [Eubacteriales bacterium]|nr:DUF134 domain-containing protein [Eubacteriales bacterium]
MSRPRKQKKICSLPTVSAFGPSEQTASAADAVLMSIEEYETIRLIDHEDLNQEQCADIMGVARSTVQRLYTDARKKLADSLVGGKVLKIIGGDYALCEKPHDMSICAGCQRHRNRRGRPR